MADIEHGVLVINNTVCSGCAAPTRSPSGERVPCECEGAHAPPPPTAPAANTTVTEPAGDPYEGYNPHWPAVDLRSVRPVANYGYRPEPMPDITVNWAELAAHKLTTNGGTPAPSDPLFTPMPMGGVFGITTGDDTGIVVNEGTHGGLPTVDVDWQAISAYRPKC